MNARTTPYKPNFTDRERKDAVIFLLLSGEHDRPDRGAMCHAAEKFGVNISTISRVWGRFKSTFDSDGINGVVSRMPGATGRKKKDRQALLACIADIPFRRRMTQQCLADELGVARSVVRDAIAQGQLLRHTNTIHPLLMKENKHARIRHALRHVVHGPDGSHFSPMNNVVYDANRQVLFDGKIGIWDFTKQTEAQRTSKNRPAGTLETKNLDSVNGKVYKRYLNQGQVANLRKRHPRRWVC
ncbi:hypothetical protein PF005_g2491 [Phytophthora fragariae]|uniref:Transposase Tc1-like domain-containing protein n=2 Tax=Phytophthora fragariae TaxID=53985 RepID=A0A6A4EIM2_9STRA|nr:hypothetical protein PF005_g2491 [Phytophthora fragariae]KAE9326766.1 hypothetical protein PF001_g2268 [Phytophthora fragariae]